MAVVNIHEAKTHFSKLVERANAGEEIVIARAGTPVARLVAYVDDGERAVERVPGGWEGRVWMTDDFDELPEDIVAAFDGE
jgi:prevent-host-death family protein